MALTHVRPFTRAALFEHGWYWTFASAARELCAMQPAVDSLPVDSLPVDSLPVDSTPSWPTREALTALHARASQAASVPALRFVPHVRKPRRAAAEIPALDALYDGSIAQKHEVPTREADWHDLFNALIFASFPRSKHALHARQLEQQRIRLGNIASGAAARGVRTREQDTLTLFDEGGCVILGTRATIEALWALPMEAFHDALSAPDAPVVALFGHALFEHMVAGLRCPSAFACGLVAPDPHTREIDAIDRLLAGALNDPERFRDPSGLRRLHFDRLPRPAAGA